MLLHCGGIDIHAGTAGGNGSAQQGCHQASAQGNSPFARQGFSRNTPKISRTHKMTSLNKI